MRSVCRGWGERGLEGGCVWLLRDGGGKAGISCLSRWFAVLEGRGSKLVEVWG